MIQIIKNIFKTKKAIGLSIHYVNQNEFKLAYCTLLKEKQSVNLGEYGEVESFNQLKNIAKDLPILINVSGKVVIEKIVATDENSNYISAAFPNSSNDEFLFQVLEQNTQNVVSLVRKDFAENLIMTLKNENLRPVNLSIGTSIALWGINTLDTNPLEKTTILGKEVKLSKHEIISIDESLSNEFQSHVVENEKLTDNQFLAFSSALNIFHAEEEQIAVQKYLSTEKKDLFHQNIFNKLKLGIPLFFFVLLLLNSVFYSHLLTENKKLSNLEIKSKGVNESLDKLKNEIENKERFLKKSNWLAQSKVSYYSDQIGILIPKEISLTVLGVFPASLIKKNNTKSYTFDDKIIGVEGSSASLKSVNDWKHTLQNQDWVKDVELMSYVQDGVRNNILFELKITIF